MQGHTQLCLLLWTGDGMVYSVCFGIYFIPKLLLCRSLLFTHVSVMVAACATFMLYKH